MDEIGVKSLGIVLLTGFFTGTVLALQSNVQLATVPEFVERQGNRALEQGRLTFRDLDPSR